MSFINNDYIDHSGLKDVKEYHQFDEFTRIGDFYSEDI